MTDTQYTDVVREDGSVWTEWTDDNGDHGANRLAIYETDTGQHIAVGWHSSHGDQPQGRHTATPAAGLRWATPADFPLL